MHAEQSSARIYSAKLMKGNSMLLLSRKEGQEIVIQGDIVVKVLDIFAERVVLGIEAPLAVSVHRAEVQKVLDKIDAKEASE